MPAELAKARNGEFLLVVVGAPARATGAVALARRLLRAEDVRRSRAVLVAMAGGAALLAAAAGFVLARDDWNWARPYAERAVARATGRELELAGDLRVDLGWTTDVEARGVRFANAEWAHADDMLSAQRVAFSVRMLPLLLRRELALELLEIDGASIELEKGSDGRDNWTIEQLGDAPTTIPPLVHLRDVRLRLLDPQRPAGFALEVDGFALADNGVELVGRGRGVYQEEPFGLRLRLSHASDAGGGRPFAVRARAGRTEGWAAGVLGGERRAVAARLRLVGPSLDDVWRLVGLPLPESPPYAVRTRFVWAGHRIELEDLDLRLGRSDLRGALRVDLPPRGRMFLATDLRARSIDFDDIEGFYGRPPHREAATGAAPPPGAASSIFPEVAFSFPKLRVADAEIRFFAERVRGATVLDDVHLDAALDRGRLTLRELRLGMAAGDLAARGVLDASRRESLLAADLALTGVDLHRLTRDLGLADDMGGTLDGRAELVSRGNSLRALAQRADGRVGVSLERGWLSRELLELVSLHIGGYLGQRLGRERGPQAIRCLVGAFDADDGVLATRALVLDTDHERVEGEGTISLAAESIDLELRQRAKRPTLGALQTPILVRGPLLAAEAGLAKRRLAVRGGVAALLAAVVHPAAALATVIDPGERRGAEVCAEAFAELEPIAADLAARGARTRRRG